MNKVTLNCTDANGNNTSIPTDGSKTFYVSIPANTYSYLQIDFTGCTNGTNGTITKTKKTKAASIEVERNKIYNIVFDTRIQSFTVTKSIAWEDNVWGSNDKMISVNGVKYKIDSYTDNTATYVPEVEGQVATADASGKYYAIYPASAATDDGKINIPSQINSLSFGEIPILAVSTTNELTFQQVFGVLQFGVKSNCSNVEITVTTDNSKIIGTFDPKNWDSVKKEWNQTTNGENRIIFEGPFDTQSYPYPDLSYTMSIPIAIGVRDNISVHGEGIDGSGETVAYDNTYWNDCNFTSKDLDGNFTEEYIGNCYDQLSIALKDKNL